MKVFISQPMNGKTDKETLKERNQAIENVLADADLAVFLKDWGTARGCNIEHLCAVNYGINRIYL